MKKLSALLAAVLVGMSGLSSFAQSAGGTSGGGQGAAAGSNKPAASGASAGAGDSVQAVGVAVAAAANTPPAPSTMKAFKASGARSDLAKPL